MKNFTYFPTTADGRVGPSFEFATLACLWILEQADSHLWRWEIPPISTFKPKRPQPIRVTRDYICGCKSCSLLIRAGEPIFCTPSGDLCSDCNDNNITL